MFTIRERTRRRCCRAGFLLLCIAPTLATIAAAVAWHTPALTRARISACEAQWSARLGLAVVLDRLAAPRPGVTVVEGMQLNDLETGVSLARVRLVEMSQTDRGLAIAASQPELQGVQIQQLWSVLHERLLRASPDWPLTVDFVAREATIHGPRHSQTFRDVRCQLQSNSTGRRVSVDFRLAGEETAEPVRFRVFRDRRASPPATRWELHTGAAALPCAAVATNVKGLHCLGEECRFQGSVWAARSSDGWAGDIAGRFHDADLDRLVTDHFPHKLSGSVEIVFERAKFTGGRLTAASGSLACQGGVVSRSLLSAAAESLLLVGSDRVLQSDEPLWRFRQLEFAFAMDGNGLAITGLCQGPQPGGIVADAQGPLLADSPEQLVPTVALVRTLAPQNEIQVPASRETDILLRALPLPTVIAPSSSTARSPYSPLRLR